MTMTIEELQKQPSDAEIAECIRRSEPAIANVIRRLAFQRDVLNENLRGLQRLLEEAKKASVRYKG